MDNLLLAYMGEHEVIPSVRNINDFKYALLNAKSKAIVLMFGDINSLPQFVADAEKAHKKLIIHLDLFEGIGKDKAGVIFLARVGIKIIITTKPHLVNIARDMGMLVIQRIFLVDSEAMKHAGLHIKKFKPDALEVLPATVTKEAIEELINISQVPVLGGGLIKTKEHVKLALGNGISKVSSSRQELW